MKKSLKTTLVAGLAVVAFGSALTFCTSKTEKPAEGQDTTQTKEEVVENDTTATDTTQDTTTTAQ